MFSPQGTFHKRIFLFFKLCSEHGHKTKLLFFPDLLECLLGLSEIILVGFLLRFLQNCFGFIFFLVNKKQCKGKLFLLGEKNCGTTVCLEC